MRLRFENWLMGAAAFGVASALLAACGGGSDTYVVAMTGGAGGDVTSAGGNTSMGSAGDPGSGGSAGSDAGGRAGQGEGDGGSTQAGGVSGSINSGGLGGVSFGGGSGAPNVGGAGGFGGSGNDGGAAGLGGASGAAGSSGSGGVSGAGGASGSGGWGGSGAVNNLIVNGDFSQGEAHWEFYPPAGSYTHAVVSGRLCVTLNSYGNVVVGWPLELNLAPALSPGGSYTLSYTAYSTQPAEVSLLTKVGHADVPYTPVIEQARTLGNSPQVFTHSFTTVSGDTAAGIAFTLNATYYASNNNICFDDVSLHAN